MSITTITIGAVDYQSYASVAEADAYLAVDPTRATAWATLTTDQKGANLVAATRRIDLLRFEGEKVDPAQTLKWPRTGVTDEAGDEVSSVGIPQNLEDATILLAGSIALDSGVGSAGTSGSNVKAVGAGSARVEFFRPQTGKALQDETAFALVQAYLDGAGGSLFGGKTGADSCSQFSDRDAPDLTEGYP